MNTIRVRISEVYKLVIPKQESDGFLDKTYDYISMLFSQAAEMPSVQKLRLVEQKKVSVNSMNYVEDNEIFKTAIKLSLPKLKNKMAFYISFRDVYLDYSFYQEVKNNNFAISDQYMKKLQVQELKILPPNIKMKRKQNKLKITMLNPNQSSNLPPQTSKDLLENDTSILIFVSGGGFVADLEKLAQFYLRKYNK